MSEDLLSLYNSEMGYVRRLAAEFATAHPTIAARLRLTGDVVEDPHVERLIEAFAYLTARIRLKLDDEFPELTDALLGVLYPHYLAPVPSLAIAQLQPPPDIDVPMNLHAGIEIETEPVAGESCRYTTCYPVTLWPIEIASATLTGRPLAAPANPRAAGAAAVLRLVLRCPRPDQTLSALGPSRLRLFLRGDAQQVYPLYELIANAATSIALADGINDPSPTILAPDTIKPVGFAADEGVLHYAPRSFIGYRLLTEFFCFPQKFMFIDLTGLEAKTLVDAGNQMEVFIYLNRSHPQLEQRVTRDNFALGCTPIVNLFRHHCDPIQLSATTPDYRIVADARRPQTMEVHTVTEVDVTLTSGETVRYQPFFSIRHDIDASDARRRYWHASRRPSARGDPGTDVYLSVVDRGVRPHAPSQALASVEALCLNADLPSRLPFGGGHPYLQTVDENPAIAKVECLTPPTPTVRQADRREQRWKLISHLAMNHLSVLDGDRSAEALKEILRLYDFRDSAETRTLIDGIARIEWRRAVARAPWADMAAFCRGLDLTLELDEANYSGSSAYLLAAVLERFLTMYCTMNSYVRLTARLRGRPEIMKQWPARAGERTLI